MASIQVDAAHFSSDTRDFIRLLDDHGVRYLIVGGEAAILYGHARLTGDVDFFYARDRDNLNRLFSVLRDFWDGQVPGLAGPEDLEPDGTIVQFGQPPNRIDLINAIEGVEFGEAWEGRLEATMVGTDAELTLPYIGVRELIRNKRAAGRPKDLDDLRYLEKGRRES